MDDGTTNDSNMSDDERTLQTQQCATFMEITNASESIAQYFLEVNH